MANVKVTQDENGVRWLELMRNGSGTLLEIRDEQEALQIINALQQSVQADDCKMKYLLIINKLFPWQWKYYTCLSDWLFMLFCWFLLIVLALMAFVLFFYK